MKRFSPQIASEQTCPTTMQSVYLMDLVYALKEICGGRRRRDVQFKTLRSFEYIIYR